MLPPKKIKIGAIQHSVVFVPVVEIDGNTGYVGSYDSGNARLELKDELKTGSSTKLAEVLLHEISHGIENVYGGGHGKHGREQFAMISGNGWARVFADNPKLLEWLQYALH